MYISLISATIWVMQFISFYSLSFNDSNGNTINMSAFEGKKILLVNTSLNSQYAGQLAELEQLYQQYKDSLVIIVFPSNDFGNEPNDNSQITSALVNTYNAHYLIAEKSVVKSETVSEINPVFQWLNDIDQNGRIHASPKEDFYKFLLDRQGNPMGIFKGSVSPLSEELKNAITNP